MKGKPRVLHVSHGGLGNGGVSAVINSVVKSLHQDYHFGCIVYTKHHNREHEFEQYGILHRIGAYDHSNFITKVFELITRPFKLTIGTYHICREGQYEIIHCHNGWESAFCLIGARLADVKTRIAHAHNPYIASTNRIKRIFFSITNKLINKYSTIKVGCSDHTCRTNYKENYIIINNAIDLSDFYWPSKQNDVLRFIHVGRFGFQKNQVFILDVFKELLKIRQDIELSLVGFGHERTDLEKKIDELNIGSYVKIIDGMSTSIPQLFAKSNYMIFPSNFEGFGIVLLEAQASGVHCFVSENIPDITNMGLWEKIALGKGAKYWAERINDRLQAGQLNEQQVVIDNLQQFDINVIIKQYKTIYDAQ